MALLASALDSATRAQARLSRVQTAVVQGDRPSAQRPLWARLGLASAAVLVIGTALHLNKSSELPPIPEVGVPVAQVHLDRFLPALPPVHPLKWEVSSGTSTSESLTQGPATLAQQLLDDADPRAHFLALTVAVEGVRTQPYWDAAGLNIGMGYNITRRLAEEGRERVTQDLTRAGLEAGTVATLMGHDRRAQSQVHLTESQAVALLREVAPDYQAKARAFIGAETFDHLRPNEQDALSYLAYNAGKNLEQFNRLRQAVLMGKTQQALAHLTPSYRTAQGDLVANKRAGAYLAAAFWSERGLTQAVRHADQFEAQVSAGRDAVAITDPIPRPTLGQRLGKVAPPKKAPPPVAPARRLQPR